MALVTETPGAEITVKIETSEVLPDVEASSESFGAWSSTFRDTRFTTGRVREQRSS